MALRDASRGAHALRVVRQHGPQGHPHPRGHEGVLPKLSRDARDERGRRAQRRHRGHRRLPHRRRVTRVPRPEEVRPDDERGDAPEVQNLRPRALPAGDERLDEPERSVGDRPGLRGQRRAVEEHVRELTPQAVRRLAADERRERRQRGAQNPSAETHERRALDAERDARQPAKVQPVRHSRVGDGEEEREREDGAHRRGRRHLPPDQRRDG